MGKIDEKDISGIVEEFEQLDYDESGTLTTYASLNKTFTKKRDKKKGRVLEMLSFVKLRFMAMWVKPVS
ncbi:hypothetical protein YC2023_107733 [Brassica napus]